MDKVQPFIAQAATVLRGLLELISPQVAAIAKGLPDMAVVGGVAGAVIVALIILFTLIGALSRPKAKKEKAERQEAPPQRTQMNYYYWYYGSLAMRQYGGDEWTQWNERLRELLVQDQIQVGLLAGSWDPNDLWGRYGGRIYSTALATLCLEVYYRYMPLYRPGSVEKEGARD